MKDITKQYSNDDITVIWKPALCVHAGECVKALPNVYKPRESPWITIENATTQELIDQIKKCPSGALSYKMNHSEPASPASEEDTLQTIEVNVMPNGPVLVNGACKITHADGRVEVRNTKVALCRCGASQNKPYCDGHHKKIGFEG